MKPCNSADNGKPESSASGFGGPRRINAVKSLEDSRRMLRRDADSAILDDNVRHFLVARDRHQNLRAPRMSHGVADQVRHRLLNELWVATNQEPRGRDIPAPELDLELLRQSADQFAEIELGGLVHEIAAKYPCVCTVKSSGIVRCDPQLIEQAVSNLIGNAVRHSGSDEILVTVACEEKMAHVVVEDHGIGIPPEHVARIFERFHRVDPARAAETGGAGLGLAIVRRIARLHGGDVVFSSVQPKGSRFTLSFLRK